MELTEELRSRDMRLDLEWIKRDENTLADALSNEDWSEFDEGLREVRRPEEMGWKVLDRLQVRGDDLYSEIQSLKEQRSLGKVRRTPVKSNRAAGKVLPKW
jgi:ribonuclease HI